MPPFSRYAIITLLMPRHADAIYADAAADFLLAAAPPDAFATLLCCCLTLSPFLDAAGCRHAYAIIFLLRH